MAQEDDLQKLYRRFTALYANARPIRNMLELALAVRAAGLESSEPDEAWLRSLSHDWVYRESDSPFADEIANRTYRRLIEGTA